VARSLDTGVVVTILCDTGTRYLSDDFWNDES
jgi:cysteine synthase B